MYNSPQLFGQKLNALALECIEVYRKRCLRLATAESCTGGLLIGCLTSISGSSDVVDRGYITYSNKAKTETLGVPEALINQHGAVSREVASAMAEGALRLSGVDAAISITGLADIGGESAEKPVGLVYIATASKTSGLDVQRFIFDGTRDQIRLSAVEKGLEMLISVHTSTE